MAQNYGDLIKELNAEEYLQFLIDTVFCFYQSKGVRVSVYDTNKKIRFITQENLQFHGLPNDAVVDGIPELVWSSKQLAKSWERILDLVLSEKHPISWIVFDRYNGIFGIMHIYATPICFHDEIAGVIVRSHNFSKLFFGLQPIVKSSNLKQVKIETTKLTLLSKREMDVLFLILFGIKMVEISSMLDISDRTARTYASRICQKFEIPDHIAFLENNLDKVSLLNQLLLPEISFEKVSILVREGSEILLSSPSF